MKLLLTYIAFIVLMLITAGYAKAGLADDLVLYLTFDNVEGKQVLDDSGNGLDAEIIENTKFVEGKYGNAIHITNETEDCVNIPTADVLNISRRITMMAWIYHEDWTGNSAQWFDKGGYFGEPKIYGMAVLNKKHRPDFEQVGMNSGIALILSGEGVRDTLVIERKLQNRTWYHIVGTCTPNTRRIYLNGEVVLESDDGLIFSGTNAEDLRIGCAKGKPAYAFEGGAIDEVAIWSRALSEVEVKTAMQGPLLSVSPKDKVTTTWGHIKRKAF